MSREMPRPPISAAAEVDAPQPSGGGHDAAEALPADGGGVLGDASIEDEEEDKTVVGHVVEERRRLARLAATARANAVCGQRDPGGSSDEDDVEKERPSAPARRAKGQMTKMGTWLLVADVVHVVSDFTTCIVTAARMASLNKTWSVGVGLSLAAGVQTLDGRSVSGGRARLHVSNGYAVGLLPGIAYAAGDVVERVCRRGNAVWLTHFTSAADASDETLVLIRTLHNLQSLNLSRCFNVTDAGVAHVAELQNLQSLNLSGCANVTDEGLARVAQLRNLQSLNLSGCLNVTDEGLAPVAELRNLQSLNLSGCLNVTDEGLARVAELRNLQSLNLSGCRNVTDAGVRHVAQLHNLQSLDLSWGRNVTDECLARVAELRNLQSLDLSFCCNVTDVGVAQVAHVISVHR